MKVIRVNEGNFYETVLNTESCVVLTFYAEWCGPCNSFTPRLISLARQLGDQAVVAKVNVDEHPELSKRFNINGIPHTFIFKAGEQVDQFIGAVDDEVLRARVQSALSVKSSPEPDTTKPTAEENSTRGVFETIKEAIQAFLDRLTGKK